MGGHWPPSPPRPVGARSDREPPGSARRAPRNLTRNWPAAADRRLRESDARLWASESFGRGRKDLAGERRRIDRGPEPRVLEQSAQACLELVAALFEIAADEVLAHQVELLG